MQLITSVCLKIKWDAVIDLTVALRALNANEKEKIV
jgi:hypothetical protein